MMSIFRKYWMRSRRTVCAALCLVFLSSLLVVPAGAADVSGTTTLIARFNNTGRNPEFSYPSNNSEASIVLGNLNSSDQSTFELYQFGFSYDQPIDGAIGLYASYYFVVHDDVSISYPSSSFNDSWFVRLSNVDGVTKEFDDVVEYNPFSVNPLDGYTVTRGVSLKARVNGIDSLVNVDSLRLRNENLDRIYTVGSGTGSVVLHVPSLACVVGLSDGDLSALEGIADSISQQSEILDAMYGDIMSLLNDLYVRLGDIQAVEELTNTYFAQLIPLVNSININTANIYSLLQTQFQLLRTLIATESDDIQSAIEKQTEDLITYFDTVFSGSTGSMPEKSDDLETSVGDFNDAESDYQSTATQRFDQLANAFSGFSGGTLGGVTLAATLFSRVWEALGEYQIVYTWPLLLGLCLVVIGRLSRLSGGQSSSVKNRGDSDA